MFYYDENLMINCDVFSMKKKTEKYSNSMHLYKEFIQNPFKINMY